MKTSGFQDRFVTGIAEPLMTVFRPAKPNGGAVLIAPGGGYIRVVIDKEGFEVGHGWRRRASPASSCATVCPPRAGTGPRTCPCRTPSAPSA